jgi:hypothetical protein
MSLLSKVTNKAPALPSRVVMYAAEKFGKTSFAAHAPRPLFLMTAGETGLLSLLEAGKVPAVDHFPSDFKTWNELIAAVKAVRDEPHDHKTLVLDTGNGAENLCAAHVCDENFGGSWADFNSYGRGNEISSKTWAEFLKLLDQVRLARKMSVLILHHAKVKTFSDPAGKSWDQWRPEAIEKLWALTHKWADVILFGGWEVTVNKKDDKATGERGTSAPGRAGPLWPATATACRTRSRPTPGRGISGRRSPTRW